MTRDTHFFSCGGGLDLVTPAIKKPEGAVIAALNYEPRPDGYRRTDGFERFDGRPQPHLASYWVLNFDAGTVAISEGDEVTDATSGATGTALIDAVVESGSYGGSDAAGYLVLTNVTGTFGDNNNLQVSAATRAVANGAATENGATNDTDHDTWLQDAIETARSAIGTVTGSGVMRGVWRYSGVTYAFRDNAGGTAVDMWKSTSTGWSQVDLGYHLDFTSGGTYEIAEDDVITGATGGATATVKRVVVTSGTWAGGDAAGYVVFASQTGTFQSENLDVGGNLNVATIAGDSTANTLAAGGRFEFLNHNFYGSTGSTRMYGVDGASYGFEFDGTTFAPIKTGMTTDTPTHLAAHKNHLFFSYAGGSVQHSGIGTPLEFTLATGASEIGIGDEVSGFLVVSKVLLIYANGSVSGLYGNDSSDWVLDSIHDEAGAIEWSIQNVGVKNVCIDATGVRDVRTSQSYGDFAIGQLSILIEPWLKTQKKSNATVISSTRVKAKNQYRLFYSDGDCLVMDVSTGDPQFMPLDYGKTAYCTASIEDGGDEWILFGSDDGYVYRDEVGTSFDGSAVSAYFRLSFTHIRSPSYNKRYHKAVAEMEAAPDTNMTVSAEFDYGDTEAAPQEEYSASVAGGGGFWSEANWNEMYWSSQAEGLAEADIDGMGTNISLVFASNATYETPHTIHGVTIHYSLRGLAR